MRGPIVTLTERWRYLDIRIPANRNVSIRIVERPGRWMEKAACDALLADMRTVVASTLAEGLEYGATIRIVLGRTSQNLWRVEVVNFAHSPDLSG